MSNNNTEQYAQFFTEGLKVTVGIPMDNNEIFRDWAMVADLEEDIVKLQLSSDVLPAAVHLIPGVILELRVGKEGKGYRCSGFFVSSYEKGQISVHLTGDVATSELREFYRIDMFLPFRYQMASTQNLDHVLSEWRSRRQKSLAAETERRELFEKKRKDHFFRAASGEFDENVKQQNFQEFNPVNDSWNFVNALAVNISAGGFKFVSSASFHLDDLVFFDVFIPTTPPRIMEAVGRVVLKKQIFSIHDGGDYYNIAIQFMLIDERDRDAVVKHISNIEAIRIRQLRQIPLTSSSAGKKIPYIKLGLIFSIILILGIIGIYFTYANFMHSTNEIQNSFQESLKKYIKDGKR